MYTEGRRLADVPVLRLIEKTPISCWEDRKHLPAPARSTQEATLKELLIARLIKRMSISY
jgi:hypothetical protein